MDAFNDFFTNFSLYNLTFVPTTVTAVSILGIIPLLYIYTALTSLTFPTLASSRILLLIAHPDDEAMFLSPTVTRLTDSQLGNHLKILCLSAGNADGLGEIRKKELVQSAKILGVEKESDVIIMDDQKNLPDDMNANWNTKSVADLLLRAFAPNSQSNNTNNKGKGKNKSSNSDSSSITSSSNKNGAPEALIDVIITFDSRGVSGHPNHTACHGSALAFLDALMAGHEGWACPVDVYTLTTVPVWRKYSSVIDCLFTILATMVALVLGPRDSAIGNAGRNWMLAPGKSRKKEAERKRPRAMLFVARPGEWWRGIKAMTRAHVSQMRWFRWGWIGLSRYMVVNDLRRVAR